MRDGRMALTGESTGESFVLLPVLCAWSFKRRERWRGRRKGRTSRGYRPRGARGAGRCGDRNRDRPARRCLESGTRRGSRARARGSRGRRELKLPPASSPVGCARDRRPRLVVVVVVVVVVRWIARPKRRRRARAHAGAGEEGAHGQDGGHVAERRRGAAGRPGVPGRVWAHRDGGRGHAHGGPRRGVPRSPPRASGVPRRGWS